MDPSYIVVVLLLLATICLVAAVLPTLRRRAAAQREDGYGGDVRVSVVPEERGDDNGSGPMPDEDALLEGPVPFERPDPQRAVDDSDDDYQEDFMRKHSSADEPRARSVQPAGGPRPHAPEDLEPPRAPEEDRFGFGDLNDAPDEPPSNGRFAARNGNNGAGPDDEPAHFDWKVAAQYERARAARNAAMSSYGPGDPQAAPAGPAPEDRRGFPDDRGGFPENRSGFPDDRGGFPENRGGFVRGGANGFDGHDDFAGDDFGGPGGSGSFTDEFPAARADQRLRPLGDERGGERQDEQRFRPPAPEQRFQPPGDDRDRFGPADRVPGGRFEATPPADDRFGPVEDRFVEDRFADERFEERFGDAAEPRRPLVDRFGAGDDRFAAGPPRGDLGRDFARDPDRDLDRDLDREFGGGRPDDDRPVPPVFRIGEQEFDQTELHVRGLGDRSNADPVAPPRPQWRPEPAPLAGPGQLGDDLPLPPLGAPLGGPGGAPAERVARFGDPLPGPLPEEPPFGEGRFPRERFDDVRPPRGTGSPADRQVFAANAFPVAPEEPVRTRVPASGQLEPFGSSFGQVPPVPPVPPAPPVPEPPAPPVSSVPARLPRPRPPLPDITPLLAKDEVERLRTRWTEVKGSFADDPQIAVQEASALVRECTELFEKRLGVDPDKGEISTEDLRLALQRYLAFFERLLSR